MPQAARTIGRDAGPDAGRETRAQARFGAACGAARGDDSLTYAIGGLAEEFGLTHRTIRHYEDEGLLSPARAGTVRVYSHRDRARLALICRGKRLGFSLAEIKEFLTLYDADEAQMEQMRFMQRIARRRIADLERQLQDVQQTLAELHAIDTQISDHFRKTGSTETQTTEDPHP